MKKISILFIPMLLLSLFSCHNESWDFPDYKYSTVYFPYQYPIRTLVLGDYESDNTNDNNLKFMVSAHIGGMYENTKDRTVNFEIVPSLAKNVITATKDSLKLLPSTYYTVNPSSQLIIPKGEFTGGFMVQLTEAFLNDPKAYTKCYVLPARITSSSLDSILNGKSGVSNPDPRIAINWTITPKDFTLFGIKFINAYHGKYLHRGQSIIKDNLNVPLGTINYHQQYVEKDEVWTLATTGRYKVTVTGAVRATPKSPGNFMMDLTFDANNNCTIVQNPASAFAVTGTGKFVKDGDMWGNKKRNAIHLSYQISVGNNTHFVTDTLVVRDRDVHFEEYVPVVY